MDATTLSRDDCCVLGKWIYGPGGQRWGKQPLFTNLVQAHKAFHQEAGKVAAAINQGKPSQAQALLNAGQPFVEAGHQVTMCLRALRESEGPAHPASGKAPSVKPAPQRGTPALPPPPLGRRAGTAPRPNAPASAPTTAASTDEWESF